ncbi:hypothetical protein FB567DRAFT_544587 [Paraphoma chrysanthemicola]|uniref:Uncharacterized protein n=1 Tax=Paraphoma chrysanthemicola TaxID=798071 RepID=A0A8K0REN2_9PLEO|nr:hypothetical protein FB567DRAFT_544587 [Paraphoma chrysanthemicola]
MERVSGPVKVHDSRPSPPRPSNCDDHTCCAEARGILCDRFTSNCPGLGALGPTPISVGGIAHPGTACRVCRSCRTHDREAKVAQTIPMANGNAVSGPNISLCRRCEFDEMRLYNERLQNPAPTGPGIAPSIASVENWPSATRPRQNLCVCEQKIRARSGPGPNCHACRDQAFQLEFTNPFHATENILRTRTKKAIQGRIPVNGPNGHYLVSAAGIANRTASGVGQPGDTIHDNRYGMHGRANQSNEFAAEVEERATVENRTEEWRAKDIWTAGSAEEVGLESEY